MRHFVTFESAFQGLVKVLIEDIAFFKAEHKYIVVYYGEGKEGLLPPPASIKQLEEEFCPHTFLRVHRNALVAKRVIDSFSVKEDGEAPPNKSKTVYQVVLSDKKYCKRYWVDLSRRNVKSIRNFLIQGYL